MQRAENIIPPPSSSRLNCRGGDRRKEANGSQQVALLINSLQQRGDKCRRFIRGQTPSQKGLLVSRPERCLPLKADHRRHCLQWCREHKN
ncbi:hypothetical protein TNCV_3180051 [Trichonephila clavipes]|nr:hypothetical protein TNCV_3180051 [Trichonephila clavipes]